MPRLKELLTGLKIIDVNGDSEREISGVYYVSRQVSSDGLFVAIAGYSTDGHKFIPQAIKAGAAAVLVEREVEVPPGIIVVRVPDTRTALPLVASNFYGAPSRQLRMVGVTGTNGKTTTSHLITAILYEAGYLTGILGTLYARWNGREEVLAHTTPESVDLERFCRQVWDEGGKYVVMEVSSHALELARVDGIEFDVALFTNLTQDHLDYHKNLDNYLRAKLKLFAMLGDASDKLAVINADDPYCSDFAAAARCRVVSYGVERDAAVRARDIKVSAEGSEFTVVGAGQEFDIKLNLAGLFNVYNALGAIALTLYEGISPEVIQKGLAKVSGVPGRFESVSCGQNFAVIVDYAHTPDGLENILKTARQLRPDRIITVFGCGGDRDRSKRPLMGEIAARYSDLCLVTSDNPRNEEPQAIIEDILPGVQKVPDSRYQVIPDRREAIRQAVGLARPNDMVIIAGKGHEDYQIVKGKVLPFDDREVARDFLRGRSGDE